MEFQAWLSIIGFVLAVIIPILWRTHEARSAERAQKAVSEPSEPAEPVYLSTWDAVQRGEEAARANVWPEGVPDYISDLESALRAVLGPAGRCQDCEWERLTGLEGPIGWVLGAPCRLHAEPDTEWLVPQGYAYHIEMGLTMREAGENLKRNMRYRMEDNY